MPAKPPDKDGGATMQQIMVGFALLLMQPPRLTYGPSFSSLLSPPPLPYRIVALLTLARLLADGADGLIRGLTIVRRPHFFHLPRPPVLLCPLASRSPAAAAREKIPSTRMEAVVQHAGHVPVADRAWTYSCRHLP